MNLPDWVDRLPVYVPMEPIQELCARLGISPDEVAKLDANENPYGPSPLALQALAGTGTIHFYPDSECRALRAGLAETTGVPAEHFLVGSGADELIDLLVRVLIEPGDKAIVCPPNFDMYGFDTLLHHGQVIEVPRREGFRLDMDAILEAARRERPKMLFLGSPNNPDGSLPSAEEIDALLELPLLVVLDEAYIEFVDGGGRLGEQASRIRQVAERDNLVVLRTFSKWAGLAGLRVGYGAFPGWLASGLWKAKQPYNVNTPAAAAALATLGDLERMAERVELIRRERARVYAQLCELPGLKPYPSQSNFVLCELTAGNAKEVQAQLLARGIMVRAYQNRFLANHLRITAGRPQDTDRLIQALKEIL